MRIEITQTSYITPDAVTLRFRKTGALEKYKAGQHGIFAFNVNGEKVLRAYSFHTAPDADHDMAITVRQVRNGLISSLLMNQQIPALELEDISGKFFIEPSPEKKRHLLMFAGGSGITPIMSMVRAILHREKQSSISVLYANRNYERMIFRNELHELQAISGGRLKVYHAMSRPEEVPADFAVFYKGRLSKLILKKFIKDRTADINLDTEFYMCGPFPYMELVQETIQSLNIDTHSIRKEHFHIPPQERLPDFTDLPARDVIIRFKGEEKLVPVPGGKSILRAALDRNIELPHSCKEGQCGVCRAWLISGEVKLRKNHVLTPEELVSNQILLCQGFPLTDDVTIGTGE